MSEAKGTALVMIVRNAESSLPSILDVAKRLFDEIVIGVDASSTDRSSDVALRELEEFGWDKGVVYLFPTSEFAAPARNRGLARVRSPWCFMQDSDEVLSPELIEWLSSAVETAPASVGAYLIPRENLIDGKPIGKATHEEHLRLFRSRFRYAPRLHESPQVDRGYGVGKGPAAGVILHHKTSLQQNRANARYTVDPTGGQKGPVRLNLGCGGRILDSSQGWINVDARDDIPGVDYVYDFTPRMNWNEHIYPYPGCLPWADNSVDEVYATHVLEHFIYHHMSDVIRDWVRVLKPGGRIEIAVPDYDDIVHRYVRGANTYLESIQLIFGGETDRFNTHFNAMDEAVLTGQLISFGCSQTSIRRLPAGSDREVRLEGRKANA